MADVSELEEAYRILDVPAGANEDAVRDARKTLAKVWHPDRYASDPELQAKAQAKLGEINEAFERVKAAGFPAAPAAMPKATPPPAASAPKKPAPAPMAVPKFNQSDVTYVPKRSLVGLAIVVAIVAVGLGVVVYLTVFRQADPEPVAHAPAPVAVPKAGTFTLGSTHDEVRAAQGAPEAVRTVINETWAYGFSGVDFDHGKVVGWRTGDLALHARIDPHDAAQFAAAKARGTIAIGSTKDEVAAVDGTPTTIDRVIHDTWSYGFSSVEFDDSGRVIEYAERDVSLHVK